MTNQKRCALIVMDLLLEKLLNYAAKDPSLTLQIRLFRLMCLTAAIVCLLVVLPINLLESDLPVVVNLADIFLGLFSLFCYWQSSRSRNYIGLFLAVLILSFNPVWFYNGGLEGC